MNSNIDQPTKLNHLKLDYDKEIDTPTATHSEDTDVINSSSNVALVYKPNEKFTNNFTLANTYIKRRYGISL